MYLRQSNKWNEWLLQEGVEDIGLPPAVAHFLRQENEEFGPVENNHIYIAYDSEHTDKSELVRYRSFTRYWKLPSDADTASVHAEYKQGILSVFVPRETPASNSIKIDIK